MGNLTTVTVGTNPGVIYGQPGSQQGITILNLDTANTVYLGYNASIAAAPGGGSIPVGPLASMQFDGSASIYAVASTPLTVGVGPGVTSYSPGSLTISGPVTAEITGPVTVEGTIDIGNTPTVDLASGATVDISGTASVDITNATLDVVGSGGFVLPGEVSTLFTTTSQAVGPGTTWNTITGSGSIFDVTPYQSIDFMISSSAGSTASGAAYCMIIEVIWTDPSNTVAIAQETFGIPVGGLYQFSVPCTGPGMFLQVQNLGSAGTISLTNCRIFGSFRNLAAFRWNQYNVFQPANDSTINWIGANNPAGIIDKWISSGAYSPASTTIPSAVLLPPASGPVNGFYQVVTTAFSNDPVVVDMALQKRGSLVAGTNNSGTLMNIPLAIGSSPTLFTQNFPVCVPALIIKNTSATGSLQFTAVQE